ncbi:MAG: 50S ribosomal protein L25/general stress protein Ctc [Parachlamydiales bacterium]|nr:50S ribosomal protein L25/general stress protein Ctc [Parachlamydiales bacterium]
MELTTFKRSRAKKCEVNVIRREGNIPAVLYSKGQAGENIAVNGSEFKAILRKVKPGCLSTTIFDLQIDGKNCRAILKDIQYCITDYEVIHLDFEELFDDVKVNVNVPIQCTGLLDCVGVKLGGVPRQVIRSMKVNCYPKDIPSEFLLDVKELGIKQTKRLADIAVPENVRPIANMNEVAIVIAKR